MAAEPASAVVVFMLQGCRRRWPPSIGISPGRTLECIPECIRDAPDAFADAGVADVRYGPRGWVRCASEQVRPDWYRHAVPVRIEEFRCAAAIGAAIVMRPMVARRVRVTLTRAFRRHRRLRPRVGLV
jgi:hypothetical protein